MFIILTKYQSVCNWIRLLDNMSPFLKKIHIFHIHLRLINFKNTVKALCCTLSSWHICELSSSIYGRCVPKGLKIYFRLYVQIISDLESRVGICLFVWEYAPKCALQMKICFVNIWVVCYYNSVGYIWSVYTLCCVCRGIMHITHAFALHTIAFWMMFATHETHLFANRLRLYGNIRYHMAYSVLYLSILLQNENTFNIFQSAKFISHSFSGVRNGSWANWWFEYTI